MGSSQVLDHASRLDAQLGPAVQRVALLLPQGPKLAMSLLAAMARGAAVPLNPRLTAAELAFVLADTAAGALIVSGRDSAGVAAARVARGLGLRVLDVDTSAEWPPASAPAARSPHDTALLLHTSGTTAKPKLVPLTAANLIASAQAVASVARLDHADVGLAVMPLFHIHGIVGVLLASLVADASVVAAPFDAFSIHRLIGDSNATWISAVPTMYQVMLQRRESATRSPTTGRLRLMRSSSAALAPSVWTALEARYSCPVVNSYGMTEAAHQMASTPAQLGGAAIGSVGRAAGPEMAVLVDGAAAASGRGEILVCGPNVTSGYIGPVDSPDDAFVGRWFRTGDVGEIDSAGAIRLLGRSKEIINVGGEKVSPFEVEAVLLAHASVREAVVFAAPSTLLGEEVHAAVVIGDDVDERSLRVFVRDRLAKVKTPTRIHIVDEIPKGPTGKVLRRSLAALLSD